MADAPNTRASDRRKIEQLIDQHHDAVLYHLRRRCDDPLLVDAAAGQTFIAAWQHLDELPANARPWLLGIARSVLEHHQRIERRMQRRRWPPRFRRRTPIAPITDELELRLRRTLQRLSPNDLEILVLAEVEGLSGDELPFVLGRKVQLERARRRLTRALQQIEPEERPTATLKQGTVR
ncbi:MAG TPA: sigma factor [Solirubrobacteraceae bacterium]|jgi:RNA polymerase sigma-70 factor (ECF subfamily)